MKKKLLAIVLTVCVLVSLFATPVSAIVFEPTPTAQLEAVTFTEKNTSKYPVEGDAITEIAAGNTFAIKISVTNPSSDPLRLSGLNLDLLIMWTLLRRTPTHLKMTMTAVRLVQTLCLHLQRAV